MYYDASIVFWVHINKCFDVQSLTEKVMKLTIVITNLQVKLSGTKKAMSSSNVPVKKRGCQISNMLTLAPLSLKLFSLDNITRP